MAIDLCIRHALVATLEALLFPLPEGGSAAAGVANDDAAIALLKEVNDFPVALVCNSHLEEVNDFLVALVCDPHRM